MSDDRSERRTYRKSPGRQYGYDFNPLRSQSLPGSSQSGRTGASPQSEPLTGHLSNSGELEERYSGVLAPRPDPRRTRQLHRQHILATKARTGLEEDTGKIDPDIQFPSQPLRSRRPTREYIEPEEPILAPPPPPLPYEDEFDYLDPDMAYEDDYDLLDGRTGYGGSVRAPIIEPGLVDPETDRRRVSPGAGSEFEEEEEPRVSKGKKKGKKGFFSRRKLIAGAVLVGGGAVAAYELGPKIPGLLESAGSNIENQVADAFNRGFAAGGEAVRKELINGLDTLEGVSLDSAIGAAKLTRVAYDVFVSPIITLASNIADDFLSALLNALITARKWLQQINADNATLVALTSILQNWVNQVHIMPKKLQTITDTDLDGAQTYLNALQRKIQEQQAILNGQATPTPKPASPTTQPGASATPNA
jgi:hypothetical protein